MEEYKPITAPPTFEDDKGREWTIKLTLQSLERVLTATQVDLAPEDYNMDAVTSLLSKPRKLGDVLWACCERNADLMSVDRGEFLDGMSGRALAAGWEALVDAIVFFIQSHSPKMAAAVHETIEKELAMLEKGAEAMIRTLKSEATDQQMKEAVVEIEKTMQGYVKKALGRSVTR